MQEHQPLGHGATAVVVEAYIDDERVAAAAATPAAAKIPSPAASPKTPALDALGNHSSVVKGHYAVKILRPEVAADAAAVKCFAMELALMTHIVTHRHIIKLRGLGTTDRGCPFGVFEVRFERASSDRAKDEERFSTLFPHRAPLR